MGLLDDFSSFIKTPEGQGLLSGAAGWAAGARKGTPWNNVGRGGVAGLLGYANAQDQQMQMGQAEQAKLLRELQIKEAQQKMADAEALRKFDFGKYYQSPQSQALANGQGPTIENAAAIPTFAPKFDSRGMIGGMMASENPALRNQGLAMLTKEETPIKLGADETIQVKNPDGTYRQVARGAGKPIQPMIEHNFSVGEDKVQPHVSFDQGVTWAPLPGSAPSAKFAKQVGPVTNVKLPSQESEFEKQLGGAQAKALIEGRAAADDAKQMIETNKIGRQILNKGMVTGFGANAIVNIGQALKTAGIDFGGDAISNSQAYTASMAQNVGKLIKQFGAGTGLSDADREYATKMAGGLITVDEKAIRKILDINDTAASNVIKLHNKRAFGVKTNVPLAVDENPVDLKSVVREVKLKDGRVGVEYSDGSRGFK